jgi:hypothetical protein
MNAQALLDTIATAYIQCALWSSVDDEGEPLDGLYEVWDLSDEATTSIMEEIGDFLDLLASEGIDWDAGWTAEQLGHDFWLTRNGHGAGFWDRYGGADLREDLGDLLTKWAKSFGSSDLYVGDDGKLYLS